MTIQNKFDKMRKCSIHRTGLHHWSHIDSKQRYPIYHLDG